MKKILAIATCAFVSAAFFTSCGTTKETAKASTTAPAASKGALNTSTKKGMDAVPAEALAEAAGLKNGEKGTTFANSVLGPWSLNGNKSYVMDDASNMYINVQYEGSRWAEDITASKAALIDVGDGDKALALNLGLSNSSDKYGILFNISKQGAEPKDISQAVVTMRVYIPEELTLPNAEEFVPTLKFAIRDPNWTQYFFSGEGIKEFTFSDIGAGWHTIKIDFGKFEYDLGSKKGTFKVPSAPVKKCNMIDLYIQGKKINSNLDVPIIIDYVNVSIPPEK